ncbi:spore photoproduct lyase family protein, partial [[Kitasatospora] papulosa]
EDVLWQPDLQQLKRSQNGALNVRYRTPVKHEAVEALTGMIAERTPWLRVRYAF